MGTLKIAKFLAMSGMLLDLEDSPLLYFISDLLYNRPPDEAREICAISFKHIILPWEARIEKWRPSNKLVIGYEFLFKLYKELNVSRNSQEYYECLYRCFQMKFESSNDLSRFLYGNRSPDMLMEVYAYWCEFINEEIETAEFSSIETSFKVVICLLNALAPTVPFGEGLWSTLLCQKATWHYRMGRPSEALAAVAEASLHTVEPVSTYCSMMTAHGRKLQQDRDYEKAVISYELASISSKACGMKPVSTRLLLTDLARCLIVTGSYDRAVTTLRDAYKCCTVSCQNLAADWKGLASDLEKANKERLALQVYDLAASVSQENDYQLRSSILSKKACIFISTQNYVDAEANACQCVKLKPDHSKGHYYYGIALSRMQKFDRAAASLLKALELCGADDEKENILIECLKARAAGRCTTDILRSVSVELARGALKNLVKENSTEGWLAVENFLLHTKVGQKLRCDDISLLHALQHNASPELVLHLVSHGCPLAGSAGSCGAPLAYALENNMHKIVAVLLLRGARLPGHANTKQDGPPMHCITRHAIRDGREMLEVLREALLLVERKDQLCDRNGNTPLHVCAEGEATANKVLVIEVLLECKLLNLKMTNNAKRRPVDLLQKKDDLRRNILLHPHVPKQAQSSKAAKSVRYRRAKKQLRSQLDDSTKVAFQLSTNPSQEFAKPKGQSIETELYDMINQLPSDCNLYDENMDEGDLVGVETEHDVADIQKGDECSHETSSAVSFDGVAWEVECTGDAYRSMQDSKFTYEQKRSVLACLYQLALGKWQTLVNPYRSSDEMSNVELYTSQPCEDVWILWEKVIAFSPRLSAVHKRVGNSAYATPVSSIMYCDKIRVWSVGGPDDDLVSIVSRVSISHRRGQQCVVQKNLIGKTLDSGEESDRFIPKVYEDEAHLSNEEVASETQRYLYYPPASPESNEFHILKLYSLSSSLAESFLSRGTRNFPFQVSELEYLIINLEPERSAPVLLVGRSGTGKTTCCLFRLWSSFQSYWIVAVFEGPGLLLREKSICKKNADSDCDLNESKLASLACVSEPVADSSYEEDHGENLSFIIPELDETSLHDRLSSRRRTNEPANDEHVDVVDDAVPDHEHLRQVFVTRNGVLCSEVKKSFMDLRNGDATISKYFASFEKEKLPSKFEDIPPELFPLFLNSKDFLLMLDASLPGESFFRRDENGDLVRPPVNWGEVKSQLTFLPSLDSDDDVSENEESEMGSSDDGRGVADVSKRQKEVTYEVFAVELWPKISERLSADCHPSLVWMEIKSFIKGSFESLLCENGHLSKEQYLDFGRKRAPNFSGNRDDVYEMFLLYEKRKIQLGYFDEGDVLFQLHQRLTDALPSWAFHEIYVDETQDFTQAELYMLMRCGKNPNAMFLSGDTAQSIMRGVAFRFSDLKSLFYAVKNNSDATPYLHGVSVPKKLHQLTHNYRSHGGILALAYSVIELITHFFPESIDQLEPDVGLFPGPKPVIIDTDDRAELVMLLQGNRRDTSDVIDFGAHQVILVANEESKKQLPEEFKCALVLSIFEAKGLEFDDVLLFNFLSDSPACKEWRVVTSYLEGSPSESRPEVMADEAGLKLVHEAALSCKSRPLDFDSAKHKILNSELKNLYTALTRARVNVWIFESSVEKRAPMFEYFLRRGLVQIGSLSDKSGTDSSDVIFSMRSGEGDWCKQGYFYYEKEQWKLARKCFERGNLPDMVAKCNAWLRGMEADDVAILWQNKLDPGLRLETVYEGFLEAATMYLSCQLYVQASRCLKNARKWNLVGSLQKKLGQFEEAARSFQKAKNTDEAVDCYVRIGNYCNAVDLLDKEKQYRKCIDLLKQCELLKNVDGGIMRAPRKAITVKSILLKACEMYVEKKCDLELEVSLKDLNMEERIDFLRKHEMWDMMARVYAGNNQPDAGARVLLSRKKFREAADMAVDLELKIRCKLCEGRIMAVESGADEASRSAMAKTLGECAEKLVLPAQMALKADALICAVILSGKAKGVEKAAEAYKAAGNSAGQLLCLETWLRLDPSLVTRKPKLLPNFVYAACAQYKQLTALISQVPEKDVMAKKLLNSLGYEVREDGCHLTDGSVLPLFKSCLEPGGPLDSFPATCKVQEVVALVWKLMADFTGIVAVKLRAWLCTLITNQTPCSSCLIRPDGSGEDHCSRKHANIALHDLETCQKNFVLVLSLDSAVRLARDHARKSSIDVTPLCFVKERDMVVIASELYAMLLSFLPYLNVVKSFRISNFLPARERDVTSQVNWCVERMWTRAKFKGVDLFLMLSILSYMSDDSYPMSEILLQQSIQATSKDNVGKRFSYLGDFNSSLEQIYFYDKMQEAHVFAHRFINFALDPSKHDGVPDLSTVLGIFEVHITITLLAWIFAGKNLLLPMSYIKHLDLWDDLFGRSGYGFTIYSSIASAGKITPKELRKNVEGFVKLVFCAKNKIDWIADLVRSINREAGSNLASCGFNTLIAEDPDEIGVAKGDVKTLTVGHLNRSVTGPEQESSRKTASTDAAASSTTLPPEPLDTAGLSATASNTIADAPDRTATLASNVSPACVASTIPSWNAAPHTTTTAPKEVVLTATSGKSTKSDAFSQERLLKLALVMLANLARFGCPNLEDTIKRRFQSFSVNVKDSRLGKTFAAIQVLSDRDQAAILLSDFASKAHGDRVEECSWDKKHNRLKYNRLTQHVEQASPIKVLSRPASEQRSHAATTLPEEYDTDVTDNARADEEASTGLELQYSTVDMPGAGSRLLLKDKAALRIQRWFRRRRTANLSPRSVVFNPVYEFMDCDECTVCDYKGEWDAQLHSQSTTHVENVAAYRLMTSFEASEWREVRDLMYEVVGDLQDEDKKKIDDKFCMLSGQLEHMKGKKAWANFPNWRKSVCGLKSFVFEAQKRRQDAEKAENEEGFQKVSRNKGKNGKKPHGRNGQRKPKDSR